MEYQVYSVYVPKDPADNTFQKKRGLYHLCAPKGCTRVNFPAGEIVKFARTIENNADKHVKYKTIKIEADSGTKQRIKSKLGFSCKAKVK